jgi:hypothetical protein
LYSSTRRLAAGPPSELVSRHAPSARPDGIVNSPEAEPNPFDIAVLDSTLWLFWSTSVTVTGDCGKASKRPRPGSPR